MKCKCGNTVNEAPGFFICRDCGLSKNEKKSTIVGKNFHGEDRSNEIIQILFNRETTEPIPTSWQGEPGKNKQFKLNDETGKVEVIKNTTNTNAFTKRMADFKCEDGGDIEIDRAVHTCLTCKKSAWSIIGGVSVSRNQMKKLFNGEKIYLEGIVINNGAPFDAWVGFVEGTLKTKFSYEDSPREKIRKEIAEEDANTINIDNVMGKILDPLGPDIDDIIEEENKGKNIVFEQNDQGNPSDENNLSWMGATAC